MRRTVTGCAVALLQRTSRASAPGGERSMLRSAANVPPANKSRAMHGSGTNGGLLVPFGVRDLLAMTSHNIGDAQRPPGVMLSAVAEY